VGVNPPAGSETDPVKLLAALKEERQARRDAEDRLRNVQPSPSVQPAQVGKTIQQELDELWETDPRKAVERMQMYAFQWYDQVNTALDSQRSAARAKYPDFSTLEPQALNYVRSLPLEQRSQPGVVEAAYFLIKGQSSDPEARFQAGIQEGIRRVQAGEAVQGLPSGTPQVGTPHAGTTATPEEAATAANMGMSVEDYLKWKK
jgi:hypothetical protein